MNVRHHSVVMKDGSVYIWQTVQQRDDEWPSIEDCLAKCSIASQVASHRTIQPSEIPQDRTFRAAWVDAGRIDVDMPKAREIHRERMRKARAPLLAALDVEAQRADENLDSAAKENVVSRKQQLRDVTKLPEIDAAQTPEELKSLWPDYLGSGS